MSNVTRLIGIIREQGEINNTPYAQLGVILSVTPFLVKLNDLTLDKDDLYIPYNLLEHNVEVDIKTTGEMTNIEQSNITCCKGNNTNYMHDLSSLSYVGSAELNIHTRFNNGDLVVLLPLQNKQKYLLINKVVGIK